MRYYPVFLDLKGKRAVVIGAGAVAERKVRHLVSCGAKVTLVSPAITARLKKMAARRRIRHINRNFNLRDLKGAFLAIAATDELALNREIAKEASRRNILLNVVDAPALCSFIVPSLVRRGGLVVAVSTGGASPALAKKLRKDIDDKLGMQYAKFLRWMSASRRRIMLKVKDRAKRKKIFERLVESDVLSLLEKGELRKAEVRFEGLVRELSERV